MSSLEPVVFALYLLFMLGIGVYFFVRDRNGGEKTYFLGDRKMGAWVSALSAGASDMSAWVLMGLPTAVYCKGMGQVWIALGLALGYALSWIFQAPRLRKFSVTFGDSITIPQFLSNRFLARSHVLQIICAMVFLVAYTIYAASSVKACGTLFNHITGMEESNARYLAAAVIVGYTFLGGFSAVCWTDFFQGLLVLGAMFLAPLCAWVALEPVTQSTALSPLWQDAFQWQTVVSGLAWGLGYFGMPHIIIRFMSIKSQKELRKSSVIGISWTVLIVLFAALIGIIGRYVIPYDTTVAGKELVFIEMVRKIFPALISGVLLSAVLAASMSTADSQLLAASSAFSCDVYKPLIRQGKANDAELLWVGRFLVLVIALLALIIAMDPRAGSIMGLVENAWGVFGAAFGPAIMLALFWRRFNLPGAIAGILVGAIVDVLWIIFLKSATGVYELLPGFVAGLVAAVVVAACTKKPSEEVMALYQTAQAKDE
ncbi:MAG: sodium/proline symporter [Oligosphaeraceae bacterium]